MNKTETIIRTEKPNSYEVGKSGDRFKIFFDTAEDLKLQIDALRKAGFIVEEN